MLTQFRKRLENNPRFQYGTINNYVSAIELLIKEQGENPSIEQLNHFIKLKCDKRQPWVKYAIREYLLMIGREADYLKLVQAKIKKPIKPKVFLPKDRLLTIVNNVTKEPYKTIAKLQMATTARASAIIRLERKRIRQDVTRIRITLREKGDKPNVVFLNLNLWKILEPYYLKGNKYIFLEKEAEAYDERMLTKRIATMYKRYLENLQEAARSLGISMSTHDIRRSMANIIQVTTNDIRITRMILDHTSTEVTERYLKDDSEQVSAVLLKQQKGL